MSDYPVIDVDSHFMEPADFWAEHLEPAFAARGPIGDADRGGATIDGDRRFPTVQWRSRAGSNLSTLNEMWARDYGRYDERGGDAVAIWRRL